VTTCRSVPVRWLAPRAPRTPASPRPSRRRPTSPHHGRLRATSAWARAARGARHLFNESGDTALHVTAASGSGPNVNQFTIEPAITNRTIGASESAILTLVRYEPTATARTSPR